MLRSFSQDDRDHMVENGKITVTCEFCSATYGFALMEVARQRREQRRSIRVCLLVGQGMPRPYWTAY